jgi:hypothetical protein
MVRLIREGGSAVKLILVRDGAASADYAGADALTGGVAHLTSEDEAAGVESL